MAYIMLSSQSCSAALCRELSVHYFSNVSVCVSYCRNWQCVSVGNAGPEVFAVDAGSS